MKKILIASLVLISVSFAFDNPKKKYERPKGENCESFYLDRADKYLKKSIEYKENSLRDRAFYADIATALYAKYNECVEYRKDTFSKFK